MQSDCMCGLYYQRNICLSYYIHIYVCPVILICIDLPSTSTWVGDNMKAYLIIVKQTLAHDLGLLGILMFIISLAVLSY